MSDFDDYIKRLLENINSSEDFLVQNPFKEIDSTILTLSTKTIQFYLSVFLYNLSH